MPSLTQGSSRSQHNGLFQIAQSNGQADGVVDQRTATERNFRCRSAAREHMSSAATAQRTKARAADWTRRLLEEGPWSFSLSGARLR